MIPKTVFKAKYLVEEVHFTSRKHNTQAKSDYMCVMILKLMFEC